MLKEETSPNISVCCSSALIRSRQQAQADGLTDIVGLKLVYSPDTGTGSGSQSPLGELSEEGHLSLVNVVNDTRIETDVRVDDQRGGEDGVDNGLDETEEEREVSAICTNPRELRGKMIIGV